MEKKKKNAMKKKQQQPYQGAIIQTTSEDITYLEGEPR